MNLVNAGFSAVANMRFQSKGMKIIMSTFLVPIHQLYNIGDIENCYHKRLNQDALKIIILRSIMF